MSTIKIKAPAMPDVVNAWSIQTTGDNLERLLQDRDAQWQEMVGPVVEALQAMLNRDELNTCQHEITHRGGVIWTICDDCNAKWADDEGGKPKWKDPKEWIAARAALSAITEE